MTRSLMPVAPAAHGKTLMGGEPLIFHCNYYNYFLQKTILLDDTLGMEEVIRAAAAEVARGVLAEAKGKSPAEVFQIATDTFAELGFGTIDFSGLTAEGGEVRVPVSHYGTCLRQASGADFAQPQSWFDAGFAVGTCEVAFGLEPGKLDADIQACQSQGAAEGLLTVREGSLPVYTSPGQGWHEANAVVPAPKSAVDAGTRVDEAAIKAALATLDFSGNEEGLLPRFGVMLTNHLGNFYNRISFEFVERMAGSGMLEAAEMLLVEAGYRCAFHTFGGIMSSPEWDAVIKPSCDQWQDWVHGMVACINVLGWGEWRVHELTDDKLVIRIYDDYESCGFKGMYGDADRPVSYLAAGGCAGIMNLIRVGAIESKPELDYDFYCKVFESPDSYEAEQTKSIAQGSEFTEVVVERAA